MGGTRREATCTRQAAKVCLLTVTAALAVAASALVAVPAGGQTAVSGFVAVDGGEGEYGTEPPYWSGPNGAAAMSIAPGGTISFAYPAGASMHNATFEGQQPICTQTSPTAADPGPRLPAEPSGPGWAGTCTFDTSAVYHLVCGLHPDMRATITVGNPSPPPGPPPPVAPPPPPPAGAAPPPAGATPPTGALGPAASGLRVAATQSGTIVRGSLLIARAGSRLDVRVDARRKALGSTQRSGSVRVGRLGRTALGARRVAFAVKLTTAAVRALRGNGRLALTLRVTVTPTTGDVYRATRAVSTRRKARSR